MSGVICIQGGREFTQRCREMDRSALRHARAGAPTRPVAILAAAAQPGLDYDDATARARAHYEQLGATVQVVPDPRLDARAALAALDGSVRMLVLPGGSPESLADVLLGATPEIGERILELHGLGMAISGASAGAMILGDYCVLPEQSRRRRTTVTHGLGLVEGVVVPHWRPGPLRWHLPDEVHLWGLPECGGALIGPDGSVEAVGHGDPAFRLAGRDWHPLVRGRDFHAGAAAAAGGG